MFVIFCDVTRYSTARLNTAKNNPVNAIAEHGYSKTLSDKLNNLEKQIERYEKMIADDEREGLTL